MKKAPKITLIALLILILFGGLITFVVFRNLAGGAAQVITYAENRFTGECKEFSTSKDVPLWYKKDVACGEIVMEQRLGELVPNTTLEFCAYLKNRANGSHCATCRYDDEYNYELLRSSADLSNDMETVEYMFGKSSGYGDLPLEVRVSVPIVYGRNTRTGQSTFYFEATYSGRVVSTEFPENTCLQ
jgi:hypothetical protein